jgi:hypothetical protein
MLFHNEKTVNTAFLNLPVMRIDRICNFDPKSSEVRGSPGRRNEHRIARIEAQKFTSPEAGGQT